MPTVRRLLRLLLLFAAVVVLLEGAERVTRLWIERHLEADADWIWDSDWPARPPRAHAFQAVGTLTLEHAAPRARLLVVADEEYLVHLDDAWVGAGAFRGEATWDAYPVGRLLRPGDRELTVTLRSGRGVGGLLLCLELEPGSGCVLRSDGSWRVFRRHVPPGSHRDEEGAPPQVWGPAHVGRWQAPRSVRERSLFAECLDDEGALGMMTTETRDARPMMRDDGSVVEVPVRRLHWRRLVEGVFFLELASQESRQRAILTPIARAATAQSDDPTLVLVTQPGQRHYASVDAHRLRSLDILGELEIVGAFVHPVKEGCEDLVARAASPLKGLLGFSPIRETPVEHELRSEP